jgi:uncharacterized alkaline shock family protein YloU
MSEEITLEGIGIAPGVLETIALVAAQGVDGVAEVMGVSGGLAGLVQKGSSRGVCVELTGEGEIVAALRISATYGRPLREIATDVQRAVADALLTHTGQTIASVDVYVDNVVFPEQ